MQSVDNGLLQAPTSAGVVEQFLEIAGTLPERGTSVSLAIEYNFLRLAGFAILRVEIVVQEMFKWTVDCREIEPFQGAQRQCL